MLLFHEPVTTNILSLPLSTWSVTLIAQVTYYNEGVMMEFTSWITGGVMESIRISYATTATRAEFAGRRCFRTIVAQRFPADSGNTLRRASKLRAPDIIDERKHTS